MTDTRLLGRWRTEQKLDNSKERAERLCSSYMTVAPIQAAAFFVAVEVEMKFLIDREDLPYDAMVPDPSWLGPIEEEGDEDGDAEAEEIQPNRV